MHNAQNASNALHRGNIHRGGGETNERSNDIGTTRTSRDRIAVRMTQRTVHGRTNAVFHESDEHRRRVPTSADDAAAYEPSRKSRTSVSYSNVPDSRACAVRY